MYLKRITYGVGVIVLVIVAHLIVNYDVFSYLSRCWQKKVVISGEVIFDDYREGLIKIGVWSHPFTNMHPPDIAHTQISQPGPFVLTVPQGIKDVYLFAMNRQRELAWWVSIPDRNFSSGKYEQNPLEIENADVEGIVIYLK